MATLAVQVITRAGIIPALVAAAAGGDDFPNTGVEFIRVKNASVTALNVTIVTQGTVDGLAIADRVVNIAAGVEKAIGPFPAATYNNAQGRVALTYDQVVTVTIGVFSPGI